jgi:hypothetical protein
MTMTEEALALLETPEARRLVATWPKAVGKTEDQRIFMWSQVAVVPPKIARKWYKALLASEIIFPNGTIAPLAAEYISVVAMTEAKVPRARRK